MFQAKINDDGVVAIKAQKPHYFALSEAFDWIVIHVPAGFEKQYEEYNAELYRGTGLFDNDVEEWNDTTLEFNCPQTNSDRPNETMELDTE